MRSAPAASSVAAASVSRQRVRRPVRSETNQPSAALRASACRAALASMPSTPSTPTNVPVQTHPPAGSKNSPSTVTNSERALGAPSSSGRRPAAPGPPRTRSGGTMLDGLALVDAHLHAARLPTLKVSMPEWAPFPAVPMDELYSADGTLRPAAFDDHLAVQGVDVALLLAEYSPRVTGLQTVEDLLPVIEHNPARFRLVGNINPYFHHPVDEEVARQAELGAVALKVHPVHGRFPANDRAMYPAYAVCRDLGLPVVVHCGTSTFPGAVNAYGDPALLDGVLTDFPGLTMVLAHGGRGWWHDAAAFLALARDNVWIELSGLPPRRLVDYYRGFDLRRLARKFIFASDWPGMPPGCTSWSCRRRPVSRLPAVSDEATQAQLFERYLGPFAAGLGLRLTEATGDGVRAELEVASHLHQPYGIVNGGVYCSVVETMASIGAARW